jgi:predicted nuclease of predicted toxin-antitoxin system
LKLLLDQNLSYKLVSELEPTFPGSSHVFRLGLDQAPDTELREYAALREFTLVTKNTDLVDLCVLRGAPPKIVWLRLGNCTTELVREVLQRSEQRIVTFGQDQSEVVLSLFRFAAVE